MSTTTHSPADGIATPGAPDSGSEMLARARDALAQHDEAIGAMTRCSDDAAAALRIKERADVALQGHWSAIDHAMAVDNRAELREPFAQAQRLATAHAIRLAHDPAVFASLRAIANDAGLTAQYARAAGLSLLDMELAGCGLDHEAKKRLAEIDQEQTQLSDEFSHAVLDATEHWVSALDPTVIEGMPDAERAILYEDGRSRGIDGPIASLRAANVRAILGYCPDRETREATYRAINTRASDIGPDAGLFDNTDRILRILALRQERARLLGRTNAAEISLVRKMARDVDEVRSFLRDLADRARPAAREELAELKAFASGTVGIEELAPWDIGYVGERLREKRFSIDQAQVRAYFPLKQVLAGLFELVDTLFGIRFEVIAEQSALAGVSRYRVSDGDRILGELQFDLLTRPGKRSGAWMRPLRLPDVGAEGTSSPMEPDVAHKLLPKVVIVCNFAAPAPDQPVLLSHGDVLTLFHETGHALHQLAAETELPSLAGTAKFEWDAVELPSQLLESFAWDADILVRCSAHHLTGAPLPVELAQSLGEARHFLTGLNLLNQIELSLIDLAVHADPPADAENLQQLVTAVQREVAVLAKPEWTRPFHGFLHLFAGGYAAGYYGYLWAERLSSDAYALFVDRSALGEQGKAFRREVLAAGATRPALDSFTAFRGREPDSEAMLVQRGLGR